MCPDPPDINRTAPSPPPRVSPVLHRRAAGLKEVLLDAGRNFYLNGDTNQAAAISLYAILSFIPLLILTLLAAGRFLGANPDVQRELLDGFRQVTPCLTESILQQLGAVEQKAQILGWVGFFTLVWFSSMIFTAMETALDMIFRTKSHRSYLVSKLLSFAMIPLGWVVGIVSFGLSWMTSLGAELSAAAGAGRVYDPLRQVLFQYLIPFALVVLYLTILYKVIPSTRLPLGTTLAGSAVFALLMEPAKQLFTVYVTHTTRYQVIFGSLDTLVILLVWVFYLAALFLLCAELMASWRRRDLLLLEKALLRQDASHPVIGERVARRFGRIFPAGARIFREGDAGDAIYYVLSGKVALEKQGDLASKRLAVFGPGDYFGEMAALAGTLRSATALALDDAHLAVVDKQTFQRLLRESEPVARLMLAEFSRRLINTNEQLEDLIQSGVKVRVAARFLATWPPPGDADPVEALARELGRDPREILRAVEDLAGKGLFRLEGSRVTGFDREAALRFLAGGENRSGED
ncbi:MAG: YihY family inner membrane protein [Acidobacteria bacterium]|nr:YihY family inner membrane protein [Acidobacteriota bacterium]